MSMSDDEDLNRAIALSLGKLDPLASSMSMSDDEDLNRAIALSLGKPDPMPNSSAQGTSINDAIDISSDGATTAEARSHGMSHSDEFRIPEIATSWGIPGVDRKKMEEERLARKSRTTIFSPIGDSESKHGVSDIYLSGTVKKTWVSGHDRAGDDIKLEEVLQKDDLKLAVLSSFQWDMPWLLAKLNTEKTHTILAVQAKDQSTRMQYLEETLHMRNIRLCFPSMDGQINCMHSKLMLLSYSKYLRIVVPTANLVRYDWGETGEMENMVFLIDLPRLAGGKRVAEEVRIHGSSTRANNSLAATHSFA
ncbi:MAG: hypothetical protein Q9163_003705 [Psora crenata]